MSNKTKAVINTLKFLSIPTGIAAVITFLTWVWKNFGSEEIQIAITMLLLLAATVYVIRILYFLELSKVLRNEIQTYRDAREFPKASTGNELHRLIMRTFKIKNNKDYQEIEKEYHDLRYSILQEMKSQYLDN